MGLRGLQSPTILLRPPQPQHLNYILAIKAPIQLPSPTTVRYGLEISLRFRESMLWNTLGDMTKSCKNDILDILKQNQRLYGIHIKLFSLYVKIVNTKISWPVLV